MKNPPMSLQRQILERIRTEHVKPTPKGFFKARDYILWILLGVFVAALSLGFGMVIFLLHGTDQAVLGKLGLSVTERMLYSIPIFWIIATGVVAAIAYANFRRTRRGYRVSTKHFAIAAAIIAVALGSVFYALNVAEFVDTAAAKSIPLYNTVEPLNTKTWFDPAHGLLSGFVKLKNTDNSFTLRDRNFDLWKVTGDHVSIVPEGFTFQTGDYIKIIGKKTSDSTFQAIEIRPYETPLRKPIATSTVSGR
ncbi:MAG TPA: hypothetical protein VFT82_00875 [Candidatus Paceibacterota bacterium]|nr:hypothetical protein [Candidatus Paceibacterota bacterium]